MIDRLLNHNAGIYILLGLLIAAVGGLALLGGAAVGLDGVAAYSTALDVGVALAAFLLAIGGLRILDNQLGLSTVERIHAFQDRDLALYLSGRLVAVGLLLGLALS